MNKQRRYLMYSLFSVPTLKILVIVVVMVIVALTIYCLWPAQPKDKTEDQEENRKHIQTYPWLYPLGLIVLASVYGGLGMVLMLSGFTIAGAVFNVGYLIWALGILHFATGFDIIKRNEIAGVFVLGIPTIEVSGMFVIVPPGIFQQEEVTALVIELPWPEDPKKVWRGKKDDPYAPVPEDYFLPIRIPFGDAKTEAERGDDPFNRRATHEVSLFVRIRVRNFFDFYARIGDTDRNIDIAIERDYEGDPAKMLTNAREQIGNMSINLINQLFTKLTPAEALESLKEADPEDTRPLSKTPSKEEILERGVDKILQNHIRLETRGWGIDVVTARVKLIEPSKSFNTALENAATGAADARGAIARAAGEKTKRTLEGQGDAAAIEAKVAADLNARTAALKKMSEELSVEPKDVLAAEIARDFANGENKTFLGLGLESFLNSAKNMADQFTSKPKTGDAS